MIELFRYPILILLLTVSFSAYFLVVNVLFSNRVEKTQRALNKMPRRAFGVGLINLFFFGVIVIVLLALMDHRVDDWLRIVLFFPTAAVLVFLGILLTFGLASVANNIGGRVSNDSNKIKQNTFGVIVLCLSCALPFAGWFLLLPYVAMMGIGAVILGFFQRETN